MKQRPCLGTCKETTAAGADGGKQGEDEAGEQVRSQGRMSLVTHVWALNFLGNEELQRNRITYAF